MVETVWKMSIPSTGLIQSPKFSMSSERRCLLEYSYENEKDFSIVSEKLIFDGVESFKCIYHKACSLEMIEAYDKVLNIENSIWLNEIRNNLTRNEADALSLKHFRIYFDDGPCYEFICRSFEVVNNK